MAGPFPAPRTAPTFDDVLPPPTPAATLDPLDLLDPRDPRGPVEHLGRLLAAEREHADAVLQPLGSLAAEIADRLDSTRALSSGALPYRRGGFWYVTRRVVGLPYPLLCRQAALGGSWRPPPPDDDTADCEVLIDGNALAAKTGYADVADLIAAPNGRYVAYTVDTSGTECYDLVVLDAARGEQVDRIESVAPRFAWWPDGSALAYSTVDATLRPDTVWVHRLQTPRADDVAVHQEPDPRYWVGVGASTSGDLVLTLIGSETTTEWRVLTGTAQQPSARLLLPRREGLRHQVDHARLAGEDVLLVLRSQPGHPDVLHVAALDPPASGGPTSATLKAAPGWTLLAGGPDLQIVDVSASAAALVVNVRHDGRLSAHVYATSEVVPGEPLAAPIVVTSARAARPHDWEQPHVRVTRCAWNAPTEVLDVEVATGRRTTRRTGPAPVGHRADDYRTDRLVVASSSDGALIPVTVLGRASNDGAGPMMLTTYGAYGRCQDPSLDLQWLELLDRGMRVAVAHVRGGGELGPAWHHGARGARKGRTFDDFLDCARHLVSNGWTSPAGLIAHGASAGGLVVAVAANREPGLFAGVVAEVPFVDPLAAMLEPALPLTTLEHEEWGDPLHDPEVRAAMEAYSPYRNVRRQAYPPMYVTVAEQDWRVAPTQVVRWVARLRERGAPRGPILLRPVTSGGHAGPSDPRERVREQALLAAWALHIAGAC